MRPLKQMVWFLTGISLVLAGCGDDSTGLQEPVEQLEALESPYLICATRNPGGIGFDFEYHGAAGGANAMDSLSVLDFEYDVVIRTIKAEKPDGSLAGMPFVVLGPTVTAVNYSSADPTVKGLAAFQNLSLAALKAYTLQSDDPTFDLAPLATGTTGKPLMGGVQTEYAKLVIGDRWKGPANNETEGDEPVWLIRTREGRLVKLIVPDFPADPAPTATGYVAIEWDFLQ
jgi:hypothetical protein